MLAVVRRPFRLPQEFPVVQRTVHERGPSWDRTPSSVASRLRTFGTLARSLSQENAHGRTIRPTEDRETGLACRKTTRCLPTKCWLIPSGRQRRVVGRLEGRDRGQSSGQSRWLRIFGACPAVASPSTRPGRR